MRYLKDFGAACRDALCIAVLFAVTAALSWLGLHPPEPEPGGEEYDPDT